MLISRSQKNSDANRNLLESMNPTLKTQADAEVRLKNHQEILDQRKLRCLKLKATSKP